MFYPQYGHCYAQYSSAFGLCVRNRGKRGQCPFVWAMWSFVAFKGSYELSKLESFIYYLTHKIKNLLTKATWPESEVRKTLNSCDEISSTVTLKQLYFLTCWNFLHDMWWWPNFVKLFLSQTSKWCYFRAIFESDHDDM